ncbi:MAG: hypothetical protein QOD53_1292 [Thermoleophilaceae bacterium]|jgi:hypothetical protein|nr:hypothetical protein [Thermoleophilaceae bacterium]
MAGEAIFIGWGQVVRGREKKAFEVFNESVQYWGSLQQDGKIEGLDVVLLAPHGGDLFGYALLKGDGAALDEVQRSDEFQRVTARAAMIVDGIGIVPAATGEALGEQMALYQAQIDELS